MLAVPAVPIEEDEMHVPLTIERLLHPVELLNRGARSAKLLGIEQANVERGWCTGWCILDLPRDRTATLPNYPRFLDFGHVPP